MTAQYPGVLLWRICQGAARLALRGTLEDEEIGDEEISQADFKRIKIVIDDFLGALESVNPEVQSLGASPLRKVFNGKLRHNRLR